MTNKSKTNNMPQADIDKIAEEIYTYFKENNARMTKIDTVQVFSQYPAEQVQDAFAIVEGFKGMQETGYNDYKEYGMFPIFGYSKDGASLEGEGYWVRGPLRVNKKGYARIPTQMFKGFLISQPHRKEIIDKMLDFAIYDRTLYCKSAKDACDFLNIDADSPDFLAKEGKKVSQAIRTRSYYFLEVGKLFDIRDNSQYSNEQAALFLMNYALGSIKGNREWQKTNNRFLLSRMDGFDSPVSPEKWSDEIKAISTRAKLDRLKRLVTHYYDVTFFGARMRGFAFSMKYTETELAAIVAVKVKDGKQKTIRSAKKGKTQAEELQEMLDWITKKGLSLKDVKKKIDEAEYRREEQKRRNAENAKS